MITQFSHLTDDELAMEVANKTEPTELELELTERLHQLQENLRQVTSGQMLQYELPMSKYAGA